jgi:hypothetical protein
MDMGKISRNFPVIILTSNVFQAIKKGFSKGSEETPATAMQKMNHVEPGEV